MNVNTGETTKDYLEFAGLTIVQRKKGYRFSMDSVLLSCYGLVDGLKGEVLDIGAGTGVISLILAAKEPAIEKVTAVELQKKLFHLAEKNVELNHLSHKIVIVNSDIKKFCPGENVKFDLIFSNPPFRRRRSGRVNPDEEKKIARHEFTLDLPSLASAMKRHIAPCGKFYMVYPAERFLEASRQFFSVGLCLDRVRPVYSLPGRDAELILMRGREGEQGDMAIERPLFIFKEKNVYSEEIKEFYGGKNIN